MARIVYFFRFSLFLPNSVIMNLLISILEFTLYSSVNRESVSNIYHSLGKIIGKPLWHSPFNALTILLLIPVS